MGVDHVRLQYGGQPDASYSIQIKQRYSWAKEWLAKHDERDRLTEEADRAEANRMARSAKNAAWAAAIAAIIAAAAAIASAVIAFSGPHP
jgi:hypothetical protein